MQMTDAKKIIEDLESERQIAVAMAKRDFHVQLEEREDQLTKSREQIRQLEAENCAAKAALEQAKQSGIRHFLCKSFRFNVNSFCCRMSVFVQ